MNESINQLAYPAIAVNDDGEERPSSSSSFCVFVVVHHGEHANVHNLLAHGQ
jgi:hypothetical protein